MNRRNFLKALTAIAATFVVPAAAAFEDRSAVDNPIAIQEYNGLGWQPTVGVRRTYTFEFSDFIVEQFNLPSNVILGHDSQILKSPELTFAGMRRTVSFADGVYDHSSQQWIKSRYEHMILQHPGATCNMGDLRRMFEIT